MGWSASPSPPTDRRLCCACVELPIPTFWQRNLSSLKWEYVTQAAGIRRFYRRRYASSRRGVNVQHKCHHLKCAWWLEPINNINTRLIQPRSGSHLLGSYTLSDWPFCVCRTPSKSSMCSEITKHFWHKCHGLFDNSPVMATVKSCLTFHSIH